MPRFDLTDADDPAARAISTLLTVPVLADELGARFAAAGHELYLVGGSVRDALLGVSPTDTPDLDFATDARPEQVLEIARGWAEGTWEVGIAFGTVGLMRRNVRFEVTTYRSEAYDRTSRNPEVAYGESLEEDLRRRDFTINAMAVSVPRHVFVDLFGGLADLGSKVLRTPGLARGVLRRRSAAHHEGGPLCRGARPDPRPGAGRGHAVSREAALHRLGGAHPRRVDQADTHP